jgi:putative ABC transport system permease protein
MWQDLRYGLRQLRLNPAFTTVAVFSLALGAGANTAIFQLVDAVRLRTLPVSKPEELAYIDFGPKSMKSGNFSTRSARLTYAQWEQIRTLQQAFRTTFAWSARRFNMASGGENQYAEGLLVTGDFFPTLGAQPLLGRVFTLSDDTPGCGSPGAVISYSFWQRQFGGDPRVLGRELRLSERIFPVVGVTQPGFFGVEIGKQYDAAIPLCADPLFDPTGKGRMPDRTAWWLSAMGRLKPGWTVAQANANLQTISPAVMQNSLPPQYRPDMAKRYLANRLEVTEGSTGISSLRRQYEKPLWLLLATTGLVLLIACANLANLLLARGSVREREIAVRQAIGASRGRLIRQLLAESLLLAALGAGLGALLAQLLSKGLVTFLSTTRDPVFLDLAMDWRMAGFAAGVAVVTCLLFGMLPALRATRIQPAVAMRAAGRGLTDGRERFGLRRALVIGQVAISMVLLVGALLFVRSLQKLLNVDQGFRPDGIAIVHLNLASARFDKDRLPSIYRDLEKRFRGLPGVSAVAEVNITPLSGSAWNSMVRADSTGSERKESYFNSVGPRYFQTMGTALLAGREFNERDDLSSPKVAIVNEAFARRMYGGANPVGRTFRIEGNAGETDVVYQVIGMVRNTKYTEVREEFLPIAVLAAAQFDDPGLDARFVLRSAAPLKDVIAEVKSAVAAVHPRIGLEFNSLNGQLRESLLRDRLMATLAGSFGLLAGLLAMLGLYGVIGYMVARRRNEIGVRMALGADLGSVVRLVLREAGLLVGTGLVGGAGLAVWAGQTAAAMLFGLKAHDALTIAAAVMILAVTAMAASYVPARRAARLQPMDALRQD